MLKKLINTKFKKDLAFSYFTQGITIGLGFIQLFLINRYFGVETYGQLAIIMSTAGIFSALLTARSSEAITRFFTREMLNNNFQNAKFILFVGFCIDVITALFMIGLTYLLSEFVAETFMKNIKFSSEVFLYSFVIFFGFLRGTIFGYFQSKEMFFLINTITIFESFIKIVALILIVFVFSNSTLEDVIWTLIVASFLSFLYALIVFLKHYIQEFWTTHLFFNKVILKEYWSFNIKTFTSSSLKAGNNNIDNLLIAYFLNAQLVGFYQIIKKILSPIAIVVGPFSMLVYPKLVHFFEKKEADKFKNLIFKISLYIFLFSIFYILVGYVFIEEIFALMNIELSSELYVLYGLLSVLILVTSMLWWTRVFSNVVDPNYSLYMNIFATIFQLTITVLATYLFSVNGLIVSMIVMNSIIGIYWLMKVRNYVRKTIYIYIDLLVNKLRILHLRLRGAKIGKGVKSFGSFKVMKAKNLTIGDNSTINENVVINCRDIVVIGSNCHLSPNVQIHTGKLNLNEFPRKHTSDKIVIEDNVWIATGSVISAGITIFRNSVIGANSVVINNVDRNCFYAGNPAKKIKDLYVER